MEGVQGITATAGRMLSQEGGHAGRVVKEVSGTLCASYMDGDRIHAYLDGVIMSRAPRYQRVSLEKEYRPESGRETIWGMS